MKRFYALSICLAFTMLGFSQYDRGRNQNDRRHHITQDGFNDQKNSFRRNFNKTRRRSSIGGGLLVSTPQRSIRPQLDNSAIGYAVNFYSPMRIRIFESGFIYSWARNGATRETISHYSQQPDQSIGNGNLSITSNVNNFLVPFRLKPFNGNFQPYGEFLIGVTNYTTKTKFIPQDAYSLVQKGVEHRALAATAGWAIGAKLRLKRGMYLEAKFENMSQTGAEVVDPNSVEILRNGDFLYNTKSIQANNYNVVLGMSFEF